MYALVCFREYHTVDITNLKHLTPDSDRAFFAKPLVMSGPYFHSALCTQYRESRHIYPIRNQHGWPKARITHPPPAAQVDRYLFQLTTLLCSKQLV